MFGFWGGNGNENLSGPGFEPGTAGLTDRRSGNVNFPGLRQRLPKIVQIVFAGGEGTDQKRKCVWSEVHVR